MSVLDQECHCYFLSFKSSTFSVCTVKIGSLMKFVYLTGNFPCIQHEKEMGTIKSNYNNHLYLLICFFSRPLLERLQAAFFYILSIQLTLYSTLDLGVALISVSKALTTLCPVLAEVSTKGIPNFVANS